MGRVKRDGGSAAVLGAQTRQAPEFGDWTGVEKTAWDAVRIETTARCQYWTQRKLKAMRRAIKGEPRLRVWDKGDITVPFGLFLGHGTCGGMLCWLLLDGCGWIRCVVWVRLARR